MVASSNRAGAAERGAASGGRLRLARRVAAPIAAASAALLAVAPAARAQDEPPSEAQDEPRASRAAADPDGPPSLLGLSHGGVQLHFDYTFASAEPTDVSSSETLSDAHAYAYAARWLVEAPITSPRWFLGAVHDVAGASVPAGTTPGTGGSTLIPGNPEIWGRGLWTSELGLSAGGGLGLVVPLPRSYSALEQEVVRAVRVVRPWDVPHFEDRALTLRPFFDLRHVTGPVTLQMRQGFDALFRVRELGPFENRYDLAGLVRVYVGLRAATWLTLGLEIEELYELTADVSSPRCPAPCDEGRSALAFEPSVRVHLPGMSGAVSMLVPLATPLRSEVASYLAARVHVDIPLPWGEEQK